MPHFIAEYSANLEGVADFTGLFEKVHQVLGDSGVFPLGVFVVALFVWIFTVWLMLNTTMDLSI